MNYFINNFMKKLCFFELRKNAIFKFNFFKSGFSLVELMISLIVISLIAAAFVPVITKKLSSSSIIAGSIGGFSKSCSKIDEDCNLCAGDICLSCKKICSAGETLNTTSCSCESNIPYYMKIGVLYVTRFNMGDHKKTQIPSSAGVTVVDVGTTCGSATDYSSKCCWTGKTSGYQCDATSGSYAGCDRTVCNWAAANAICASYNQDGRTWRLPTQSEVEEWADYSVGKWSEGLMLCDDTANAGSPYCFQDGDYSCSGTFSGCFPYYIWTENLVGSEYATMYHLHTGYLDGPYQEYRVNALSVRCVSELIPNCASYNGDTCNACRDGYYLSGNECKKPTEVENCETYSKTENKCESCKSGYKLNNNKCEVDNSYYVNINGLLVTKYNMGDSSYTKIPSSAGVTVANVGSTCGTSSNYSTKCCWKGATSGTNCDTSNGSYSGCGRTVCNWAAANAICASYSQDGKTWRLPKTSEMYEWLTYSKGKNSDGLMLCDASSGNSSALCSYTSKCMGSLGNSCWVFNVWSTLFDSTTSYYYMLSSSDNANWELKSASRTRAQSVRCVSELVPNCATYSGNTCTACKSGYYLSGGKCYAHTTVANCASYSATQNKCESCNSGYYLSGNQCKLYTISNCASYSGTSCVSCNSGYYLSGGYCYQHSYIANCATMSTTSDTCLSCYSGYTLSGNTCKFACSGQYFMQVGNVCVTKYNMGDSTSTAIPSGSATVVNAGSTCGTSTNYTTKCCWKGSVSSSSCDSANGSYSGCNRTVCNWTAAKSICSSFSAGGKTWRLPKISELANWNTSSKSLGDNGLMLCDKFSGKSASYCSSSSYCVGGYGNTCYPSAVWSGEARDTDDIYRYYLENGTWATNWYDRRTRGFSVRCVTEI